MRCVHIAPLFVVCSKPVRVNHTRFAELHTLLCQGEMQSMCCACTGDHKAGELEEHMAGCLHSWGGAAQASLHHPVLAPLPQSQEAHLCWLLTASGRDPSPEPHL